MGRISKPGVGRRSARGPDEFRPGAFSLCAFPSLVGALLVMAGCFDNGESGFTSSVPHAAPGPVPPLFLGPGATAFGGTGGGGTGGGLCDPLGCGRPPGMMDMTGTEADDDDAGVALGSDRRGPAAVAVACPGPSADDLAVPMADHEEGCDPRTCVGDVALSASEAQASSSGLGRFSGCTMVAGDLIVSQHEHVDLPELACLQEVSGSLVIWNSPKLERLAGLEALRRIGGDLQIGRYAGDELPNRALASLEALGRLRVVGGDVALVLPAASSLAGLADLQAIGGDLYVDGGPGTADVADAGVATSVPLADLSGLSALRVVGGDLVLDGALESSVGLSALTRVGGRLEVRDAGVLSRLDGLGSLRCVGHALLVRGGSQAPALSEVAGLSALSHVGDDLVLEDLGALTGVTLPAGLAIGGWVVVRDNPQLSVMAWPQVPLFADAFVQVTDNPMLSACEIGAFLAVQAEQGFGGRVEVAGNLPCEDP